MKNFSFKYKGKQYWHSRSLGAAIALISYKDRVPHVLMVKRGKKDNNFEKWCIPGGFLDYDETLYECAVRELHEETGVTLSLSKDEEFLVQSVLIDDPKASSNQNITMIFKILCSDAFKQELTTKFSEPGEILDIKWFKASELNTINLAYNKVYQENLKKLINETSI